MSFAREVKKELLGIDNLNCCQNAEFAGILHLLAEVSISFKGLSISIKTPINSVIRHLLPIFKHKYGLDGELG